MTMIISGDIKVPSKEEELPTTKNTYINEFDIKKYATHWIVGL